MFFHFTVYIPPCYWELSTNVIFNKCMQDYWVCLSQFTILLLWGIYLLFTRDPVLQTFFVHIIMIQQIFVKALVVTMWAFTPDVKVFLGFGVCSS